MPGLQTRQLSMACEARNRNLRRFLCAVVVIQTKWDCQVLPRNPLKSIGADILIGLCWVIGIGFGDVDGGALGLELIIILLLICFYLIVFILDNV